jgi:hypothetical protein
MLSVNSVKDLEGLRINSAKDLVFRISSTEERFFAPLLKWLRMTEKALCNGLLKF